MSVVSGQLYRHLNIFNVTNLMPQADVSSQKARALYQKNPPQSPFAKGGSNQNSRTY